LPKSPELPKKSKLRRFEGVSEAQPSEAFSRNPEPKAKDLFNQAQSAILQFGNLAIFDHQITRDHRLF
jgi:hypothetical protein